MFKYWNIYGVLYGIMLVLCIVNAVTHHMSTMSIIESIGMLFVFSFVLLAVGVWLEDARYKREMRNLDAIFARDSR